MGYNYPILRTITNRISIINLVLLAITAGLADMVRTYKRKTLPPSYPKEDINTTVENVKSGRTTLYRAAKLYKIPTAALCKHVKGLKGVKSQTLGRPTALPFHEKKKLHSVLS